MEEDDRAGGGDRGGGERIKKECDDVVVPSTRYIILVCTCWLMYTCIPGSVTSLTIPWLGIPTCVIVCRCKGGWWYYLHLCMYGVYGVYGVLVVLV